MVSLNQLIPALESIGAREEDIERVKNAQNDLVIALDGLNYVKVAGRRNVDVMLGCMMAIEAIIGKEDGNG